MKELNTPTTLRRNIAMEPLGGCSNLASCHIFHCQLLVPLRSRNPQDRKVAPELFEVSIGGHQCGLSQNRQGRRHAIHIWNLVNSLKLARLEGLGKIGCNKFNGKLGKLS